MSIRLGLSFDDVLLVPQLTLLKSRAEADTTGWITPHLILKTPFLSSNMDTVTSQRMALSMSRLGGTGVIHQFQSPEREAAEVAGVKKADRTGRVAAAVGVMNGLIARTEMLIAAGVDLLVVDAAHGHSPMVAESIRQLKNKFPKLPVLAGNIATADAAKYLIAAGADAVKVGVGPGSVCTTRIVSGSGVPQLTAIMDIAAVLKKYKKPIGLVADGGIKQPGDVVKALAAGATAVMCGNIFAGTLEAPGRIVVCDGKKYKQYRGSSTMSATKSRIKNGDGGKNLTEQWSRVEGVEGLVPYRGSVTKIIEKFLGGLRSGMSYGGARNLKELQTNADFIRCTSVGLRENAAHDVVL